MTAYETIMVILGLLGLLVAFGGFLIMLLKFLERWKK